MCAKVGIVAIAVTLSAGAAVLADDATILAASVKKSGANYSFSVTLEHADTGWEDYADGWEIVDEAGTRLGFRELLHPHVNEQPFTRSLSNVSIPAGASVVYIRARTNTHGWGEARFPMTLN